MFFARSRLTPRAVSLASDTGAKLMSNACWKWPNRRSERCSWRDDANSAVLYLPAISRDARQALSHGHQHLGRMLPSSLAAKVTARRRRVKERLNRSSSNVRARCQQHTVTCPPCRGRDHILTIETRLFKMSYCSPFASTMRCHSIHLASAAIRCHSSSLARSHRCFCHVPVSTSCFFGAFEHGSRRNHYHYHYYNHGHSTIADIFTKNAFNAHPRIVSDPRQSSAQYGTLDNAE